MTMLRIALAASLAAGQARAQPTDNAAPRAAAAAFDRAQQQGDRTALERLLAPDFLFVRANGQVGNKGEFVDGFTAPDHRLEPYRIVDPLFVRVSADAVIVGGEASLNGSVAGRPFTQHFRFANTLGRRGGAWVVVYSQITGLPPR